MNFLDKKTLIQIVEDPNFTRNPLGTVEKYISGTTTCFKRYDGKRECERDVALLTAVTQVTRYLQKIQAKGS